MALLLPHHAIRSTRACSLWRLLPPTASLSTRRWTAAVASRCKQDLPETRRAVRIRTEGSAVGPEVLEPCKLPLPWDEMGSSDVMIQVEAAGVNRPDVLQRRGAYPPPPGHSPLPGLEVAGRVVAFGSAIPPGGFYIGDRICALTNGGGYAEYCVAPAAQCLPVPNGLTSQEAACVPETFFTCWHNLFQQTNIFGERLLDRPRRLTVLVHGGTSGIGTTAIQLCRAFGIDVVTTAGSKEKCAACLELGALAAINYREVEGWDTAVMDAVGGDGFDVVLDMVCGSYMQRNLNVLKVGGRIAVIGSMGGYAPESIDLKSLMRRRLTIGGSTIRARDTATKGKIADELRTQVWPLFAQGRLRVVMDSTHPLEKASEAHKRMESNKHIGKIALVVD
eukprot:TRINITY_DN19643_c0_g1_i1.p1 TRINITY_DN19643_c0_g1~~TRINITY_DN19643_c0_g1_i1.p1  ORF type:complete len:392 (+),score=50.53 TRINITY_DN19643_c0_g1_i1:139-1314(+)